MIQTLMSANLESVVGALFVIFYAFERFGRLPPEPGGTVPSCHSRATTTAAAYYTAVVLYCGVGLSIYAGLLLFPALLDRLEQLVPDIGGLVPDALRQSPPVVVALLLTALLPKVPVLAAVDEFFRTRLQHMAAIPQEVRRLAAELRRAPFQMPEGAEREELTAALAGEGFEPADLQFETGTSPQALWTRLSALMRRLEAWEAESQLEEYFLSCPGELAGLRERYEDLRPKVRQCLSLSRQISTAGADERAAAVGSAFREDITNQIEALFKAAVDAVSRAVLLCDLTQHRRAQRLRGLGFEVQVEALRHISLNSLMLLFTAGSVLFTMIFVVSPRPGEDFVGVLLRSVMIAAIYCAALWCAVMPKGRWPAARRQPGSGRPWCAYLLSGVLAAAVGTVVNFATKLVYFGDVSLAWARCRENMPWTVMTFVVAYAVAALADDEPEDVAVLGAIGRRLWLVEALAMAAVMLPTGLLVQRLLHDTTPPERMASLTLVLTTTAVVAFAIGALVPSWYRSSPQSAADPRLSAVPAAAAAR
ncbi:MAG TPA: hypothetical protein VEL75_19890 [Candidatus Methylomirabilis sp.]|nr:hypothetical protein [Candidatus Methylomirabilis sp.]